MRSIRFSLSISPQEMLRYYRGEVQTVIVTTEDGLRAQFPAVLLRAHVTENGIFGRFQLTFDSNNRQAGLKRIP